MSEHFFKIGRSIGKGVTPIGNRSRSSSCTPRNLEVTQITGGNRLEWDVDAKCTDADGYEIWVSIDGAARSLIDTVDATTFLFDDTTDYAGSQVTYEVRAYRGTSYGAFSDPSEIVIEPVIANLAAVWEEDHAVISFDGFSGWQTEVYESRDNTNWTLVTTLDDGVEEYDNHTWQGTTVYFRARCKKVAEFGDYTSSINIATPLVFKWDASPIAALSFSLSLTAGKTVRVSWGTFQGGVERYNDYSATGSNSAVHTYNIDGEDIDPAYVKISGDLNGITELYITVDVKFYGDLSKWVLPVNITKLHLFSCAFTGDISGWSLPSGLVDCRIYRNAFTGDLSSWVINTVAATIMYLEDTNAKNEFTGIPRGNIHQCEASVSGLYMRNCAVGTAALDAWLAWANNFLASNAPVRNSLFYLGGTGMGIPTGGNNNADRLGIIAKYTAAGSTGTVTTNT